MIFIDTHITLWLYDKRLDLLSEKSKELLEKESVFISPVVKLEMAFLKEIGRIKDESDKIIEYLHEKIGLEIQAIDLLKLINVAIRENWTRDPFDRLIVSHARGCDAVIITKDTHIQKNYFKAIF